MTDYIKDEVAVKKTRKDHSCFLCGWTIPKGSDCIYWQCAIDGKWCCVHVCHGCMEYANCVGVHEWDGLFSELAVIKDMQFSLGFKEKEFLSKTFLDYGYTESQIEYLLHEIIGE